MAQSPPGSEDRENLVAALIVAAKTGAAAGDPTRTESLLREAREEAKQLTRTQELTSLIPLANSKQALAYVRRVRAVAPGVPVIVLTGLGQPRRDSAA